ncbi:LLM class flavin-dependent oxidoreductase [Actinopolyspora mortivallis]|uniref:5,10-methylene tetrahydromethanopterin reductase n=1 Tax=Actinopolyspora mortivallis TaxID=33906 RepID=A0A2T0GSG6_ACTMO|nr:LLM class flavin-dependent oxidoreductase [Actinopolyspora mortivallis]PRW62040.1 5,10-methylene tetrahydromethanopterin reductase [Actinopolyspora mortivallis]
MRTLSVLIPFAPTRPEQVLPWAAFVQWSEAYRLWQGQGAVIEPHQTFTVAAASGFRIPVGTGVTLMPFEHPFQAALQVRTLAMTTGHPLVAGYGPGAAALQRGLRDAPYGSQLGAVREYVDIMRGLLVDGSVDQEGTYFSCHNGLTPLPRPSVEIGLGVLRPGMARLAGEIADVAITWLTPARYIEEVLLPELRVGADRAGRPVPRVAAIVPLALSGSERTATELVLASNAEHVKLPHYVDMLRRSGIDVDTADPTSRAEALLSGRAFLNGNSERIAEQLEEFDDAGVDEIVLNFTGVCARFGIQAALGEAETVLGEIT